MKRLLQGLLPLLVVGLSYSSTSVAESAWYTCSIDTIGSAATQGASKKSKSPVLQLDETSGLFLDQQFVFKAKGRSQAQMLAIALSAASSGFQIQIRTDLDSSASPLIIEQISMLVGP
jgi:hypothetical protein